MGTITVAKVTDRASKTLYDEAGVLWSTPELVDYCAAGINAICANKPDAYVVSDSYTLFSGSKQEIPPDGVVLLDVIRNKFGRSISQVDRNHLDATEPDWHEATGTQVECFTFDERYPKEFYVYPCAVGDIEIVYSALPPRVTATTDTILIDDLYENPLYHFVLGMAYAKNTKRQDLTKSTTHLNLFSASIGAKAQVQIAYSPNTPDEGSTR